MYAINYIFKNKFKYISNMYINSNDGLLCVWKLFKFWLPIIILLCLEGMFLVISGTDFIILYAAIELQSLALYILATQKRFSILSVEAGLKYFIYGSFASGILLYGFR